MEGYMDGWSPVDLMRMSGCSGSDLDEIEARVACGEPADSAVQAVLQRLFREQEGGVLL